MFRKTPDPRAIQRAGCSSAKRKTASDDATSKAVRPYGQNIYTPSIWGNEGIVKMKIDEL